jgi:hypothetical protein
MFLKHGTLICAQSHIQQTVDGCVRRNNMFVQKGDGKKVKDTVVLQSCFLPRQIVTCFSDTAEVLSVCVSGSKYVCMNTFMYVCIYIGMNNTHTPRHVCTDRHRGAAELLSGAQDRHADSLCAEDMRSVHQDHIQH